MYKLINFFFHFTYINELNIYILTVYVKITRTNMILT